MDRLSDTYNVDAHTSRQAAPSTVTKDTSAGLWGVGETTATKIYEMFYRTGSGANASNDICGSIRYSVTYSTLSLPGEASVTLDSLANNLTTIAKNQVYNSVVDALNEMQPKAQSLADRIYSGNPSDTGASLRDDATVQTELREMANAAAAAIISNRAGLKVEDSEAVDIQKQLAAAVTENGWVMAPIWQRGLATLYAKLREVQSSLQLDLSIEHRIQSVFGTGAYGFFFSDNDVSRASFAPVERDFEYLANQLPFVTKLSQPDADSNTSQIGRDAGSEMGSQALRGLYSFFINELSPTAGDGYVDPFREYAEIGSGLFMVGAPLLAGGSIVAGLTADIPLVGSAAAVLTGPIKSLGYYTILLGFSFMIVIPAIPLLYFVSAVISWFAVVIEAVFGLPLALLVWLVPAREPSMIGPMNKIMVTIAGLLLRPFFTVLGLIVCLVLLWVGNELLAVFFRNMLLVMTPDWQIMSAVLFCGLIGLYCYSTLMLALHCSSAITLFGDSVMNWIGGLVRSPVGDAVGASISDMAHRGAPMPGLGFAAPSGTPLPSQAGYKIGKGLAGKARQVLPNNMGRLGRG